MIFIRGISVLVLFVPIIRRLLSPCSSTSVCATISPPQQGDAGSVKAGSMPCWCARPRSHKLRMNRWIIVVALLLLPLAPSPVMSQDGLGPSRGAWSKYGPNLIGTRRWETAPMAAIASSRLGTVPARILRGRASNQDPATSMWWMLRPGIQAQCFISQKPPEFNEADPRSTKFGGSWSNSTGERGTSRNLMRNLGTSTGLWADFQSRPELA